MNPFSPFRSFWMGGFEGADHLNAHALPLDMAHASGHADRIDEDYAAAARLGLRTVRESIGWRLAEPAPGRYDFSRAVRCARAAERHGLQIQWTLMHYGTPPEVSLLDDAMVPRFARFAAAAADVLAPHADEPPVYTPVNEIGFVAWTVSETNHMHPYRGDPDGRGENTLHSGYAVKRRLVQAALAGIDAIRRVDPRARFLHVEPLVHVVAPHGRPELAALAEQVRGYQWQAWDLLAGRLEPELGGHAEALDLLGINHYHSGQWEVATEARLEWHLRDPRRLPLSALLAEAWQRYGRPLLLAETSHFGAGRSAWLDDIAAEVERARSSGLPVLGLCLYPLVDRPDWNDPSHWHESGLYDVASPQATAAGRLADLPPMTRVLHPGYAATLGRWQARLPDSR
jgi:hypothetical protein